MTLIGTEKQINWATSIKESLIAKPLNIDINRTCDLLQSAIANSVVREYTKKMEWTSTEKKEFFDSFIAKAKEELRVVLESSDALTHLLNQIEDSTFFIEYRNTVQDYLIACACCYLIRQHLGLDAMMSRESAAAQPQYFQRRVWF